MRKITQKSNTVTPDKTVPFGNIRDKTTLIGGTPVNTDVYEDMHQFYQKLFEAANVKPNELKENSVNGFQMMAALGQMISRVINPMVFDKFFSSTNVIGDFTGSWLSIAYGSGIYVRAGNNGTAGIISISPDGINHELVLTAAVGDNFVAVDVSDTGVIIGIAQNGGFVSTVYTSLDYGQNWTTFLVPGSFPAFDIAFASGSEWGIIGLDGTGGFFMHTTDNGANYITTSLAAGTVPNKVIYGGGQFCITLAGTGTQQIAFTVDGSSFTLPVHTATINQMVSATYAVINEDYYGYGSTTADKVFIIVSNNVSGVPVALHGDETALTTVTLPNENFRAVEYGNGKIVMLSISATNDANITQSFDFFRNFQAVSNSLTLDVYDVAYAGGKFVMCGVKETTPLMQ